MECDSNLEADAAKLRPLFRDVPQALAELELYQQTRKDVRALAYTGSLGLLVVLGGLVASRALEGPKAAEIRSVTAVMGLSLAGVSLFSGLTRLKTNERRLENAVDIYNQARPSDPIELRFSTGFTF